jgi:hypothetical protein
MTFKNFVDRSLPVVDAAWLKAAGATGTPEDGGIYAEVL